MQIRKAKLNALNAAKRKANEVTPLALEVCKAFVGQKVKLKSGGLSAKFKKAISHLTGYDNSERWQIRVDAGYSYSAYLAVKCWASEDGNYDGPHTVEYAECNPPLFSMENGVLTEVREYTPERCDYTVAECKAVEAEISELEDRARALKRKLPY